MAVENNNGIMGKLNEGMGTFTKKIGRAPDLFTDYFFEESKPETRETVRKVARVVWPILLGGLLIGGFCATQLSPAGILSFLPASSIAAPSPIGALSLVPALTTAATPLVWGLSNLLHKEQQHIAAKIAAIIFFTGLITGASLLGFAGMTTGFSAISVNHYLFAMFFVVPSSILVLRKAIIAHRRKWGIVGTLSNSGPSADPTRTTADEFKVYRFRPSQKALEAQSRLSQHHRASPRQKSYVANITTDSDTDGNDPL